MKTRNEGRWRVLLSFVFALTSASVVGAPECLATMGRQTVAKDTSDSPPASPARKTAKHTRRVHWRWDSDVSFRGFYDNNILDYSDRDRRQFRDRTHPNKYSIRSLDDWINELGVHAGLRHGTRSRGEYRLRLLCEANIFATNAMKNSVHYEIDGRWAHRNQSVTIRGGWTPHFYLRDLIVHDSTYAHPGSSQYASATYHVWTLDAEVRFRVGFPFEQRLAGGRKRTDYGRRFNERDNTSWWGRYGWVVGLSNWAKASLSYQFLSLDAAGAHDSGAASDISQDEHTVAGGLDFDLTKTIFGSMDAAYERQNYSSIKPADVSHVGRRDEEWRLYAEGGALMSHGWRILLFERWTSAASNTALATDLGAFVDNQVGIRVTHSW